MGKPEGKVESYLRTEAEKMGYMCLKFTSPANSGVPDRILIGHGQVFFVELKAPGEKPRKLQVKVGNKMRKHGAEVYIIDTTEKVNILLRKKCPKSYQKQPDTKKPSTGCRPIGIIKRISHPPDVKPTSK